MKRDFPVATAKGQLRGHLASPERPKGLILVAHLQEPLLAMAVEPALAEFGVLSLGLMIEQDVAYSDIAHNVPLLTERLLQIFDRIRQDGDTETLPLCLYATGHATPAAIRAAAQRDTRVKALVCHGGQVDMAGLQYLNLLTAPLLLLLDEGDHTASNSYRRAAPHIAAPHQEAWLHPGENPAWRLAQWFGDRLQAI